MPNPLKIGTDTQVETNTVVREVLRTNYRSRNPIGPYHFLGISPAQKIQFRLPDRFLPGGTRLKFFPHNVVLLPFYVGLLPPFSGF